MKFLENDIQKVFSGLSIFKGVCLSLLFLLCFTPLSQALEPSHVRQIVKQVGEKISEAADKKLRNIIILGAKDPNAWIYPDRTIIITTALCHLIEIEDELAFVIAHELAHIKNEPDRKDIVFGIMSVLSIKDENGLQREIEADTLAVDYLRKAGYRPFAVLSILKKMPPAMNFDKRMEGVEKYMLDYQDSED